MCGYLCSYEQYFHIGIFILKAFNQIVRCKQNCKHLASYKLNAEHIGLLPNLNECKKSEIRNVIFPDNGLTGSNAVFIKKRMNPHIYIFFF